MGQSTDAILCWGIALDPHSHPPWKLDAEELGYDDPLDPEALVALITGEKLQWREANERLEELGIEVVMHGHHEEPMIILAAAGTVTTAHRGYPKTINIFDMDAPAVAWATNLNRAAHKLGLGPDFDAWKDATWYLCSWWG